MTINELLSKLKRGDKIEFEYMAGITKKKKVYRLGTIVQVVAPRFITVDNGRYRQTLDIWKIEHGHIKILLNGRLIGIEKDRPAPVLSQGGRQKGRSLLREQEEW